jgi:hypothetical protein
MNWPTSIAGLLVGILVGATGVGGGAVMTPLLVLVLGVAPHTAIGTDLLYASATKMFGVGVHGIQRRVDWQIVMRLAAGSLPAALATLFWLHASGSQGVRDKTILVVLGVVLILTALSTLLMPLLIRKVGHIGHSKSEYFVRCQPVLTVLAGVILGLLVTLTSIGAGAMGAVMLVFLYPLRLSPARLVGTDLAHAIPLALVAGAGHILLGNVNFTLLWQLLLGSIPGVWIGAHFGGKLPDSVLRVAIALVLGTIGLKMLI